MNATKREYFYGKEATPQIRVGGVYRVVIDDSCVTAVFTSKIVDFALHGSFDELIDMRFANGVELKESAGIRFFDPE